ncbi:MAG: hypothetical protein OHK0013_30610 [Sandaracinaceae bacterium]
MSEAGRKRNEAGREGARTQPAIERAATAADSGTRARRVAPTQPLVVEGVTSPASSPTTPPPGPLQPGAPSSAARLSSPGLAIPRVLIAGGRPSETASLARSFVDAGALARVCPALGELPTLLASMRWTCVMVDVRWEHDVREIVRSLGHHVPIELYVPTATLAHRGHVLPLGRADAEELLEAHRARPNV